jgi:hypothetical protein
MHRTRRRLRQPGSAIASRTSKGNGRHSSDPAIVLDSATGLAIRISPQPSCVRLRWRVGRGQGRRNRGCPHPHGSGRRAGRGRHSAGLRAIALPPIPPLAQRATPGRPIREHALRHAPYRPVPRGAARSVDARRLSPPDAAPRRSPPLSRADEPSTMDSTCVVSHTPQRARQTRLRLARGSSCGNSYDVPVDASHPPLVRGVAIWGARRAGQRPQRSSGGLRRPSGPRSFLMNAAMNAAGDG